MFVTTKRGQCYHMRNCSAIQNSRDLITTITAPQNKKKCTKCMISEAILPAIKAEVKSNRKILYADTEGTQFVTQIAAVEKDSLRYFSARSTRHTRLTAVSPTWIIEERNKLVKFAGDGDVTVVFHNLAHDRLLLDECYREALLLVGKDDWIDLKEDDKKEESFFPKNWTLVDSVSLCRIAFWRVKMDCTLNSCFRKAFAKKTGEHLKEIIRRELPDSELKTELFKNNGRDVHAHNALVDSTMLSLLFTSDSLRSVSLV